MRTGRRKATPRSIGTLDVLLAPDGCAYVRLDPAPEVSEGPLVTVVAVSAALRATLASSPHPRSGVSDLLAQACGVGSATEFAHRVGLARVVSEAPPLGTSGPYVRVAVQRTPDLLFDTLWTEPPVADPLRLASRVLAALWSVADRTGHGAVVEHALYTLRGGFEESGGFPDEAGAVLMSSLLDFGVEMAVVDARAAESRSRLRVV